MSAFSAILQLLREFNGYAAFKCPADENPTAYMSRAYIENTSEGFRFVVKMSGRYVAWKAITCDMTPMMACAFLKRDIEYIIAHATKEEKYDDDELEAIRHFVGHVADRMDKILFDIPEPQCPLIERAGRVAEEEAAQTRYRIGRVMDVLRANKLAVIATNNIHVGGSPESALIAYCIELLDDCPMIYFQTAADTRKMKNIEANPNVSLAIGLDMSLCILQYEGEARRVDSVDEVAHVKQLFLDCDSPTRPEHFKPNTLVYRVKPTWIGFSDYTREVPECWSLEDRQMTRSSASGS
jgi:hypothetical protein